MTRHQKKKNNVPFVSQEKRQDNYLTRRRLASIIRTATRQAAKETEAVMGYSVYAANGWIVRRERDGSITKLSPIARPSTRTQIFLD